jgi:hypothetical protein
LRALLVDKCEALRVLTASLERTVARDDKLRKALASTGKRDSLVKFGQMAEDVLAYLVKLVRCVANLSIHREAGAAIARAPRLALLVKLLGRPQSRMSESARANAGERKEEGVGVEAELLLNVVSCVTNVSFYFSPPLPSSSSAEVLYQEDHQNVLLAHLMPCLCAVNGELQMEAVRAFGNLSRCGAFRGKMAKHRVLEALLLLLEHTDLGLVHGACGAILNCAGDSSTPGVRAAFVGEGALGMGCLLRALDRLMLDEAGISLLVCKAVACLVVGEEPHSVVWDDTALLAQARALLQELVAGLEWVEHTHTQQSPDLARAMAIAQLPPLEKELYDVVGPLLDQLEEVY